MIYILSLSTVIKEVNSSAPRVRSALVTELGEVGCPPNSDECASRDMAAVLNDVLEGTDSTFGGARSIPSQQTIDLIVREMYEDDGSPTPGLDKLARNTNPCSLAGGLCADDEDALLDPCCDGHRRDRGKRPRKSSWKPKVNWTGLPHWSDRAVDQNGNPDPATGLCTWQDLGLTMTLTGLCPSRTRSPSSRSLCFGKFFRWPWCW